MNNRSVIIFGTKGLSSLIWYCLANDTTFSVKGFVVDREYMNNEMHEGLPVFRYDQIEEECPPEKNVFLIPTGYKYINGFRMERYYGFKEKGYQAINYVSSRASIWPDLNLNGNCMIYDNVVVQPFTVIGENVIIRSSAHISHHNIIESHSFIAAGATLGGHVTVGTRSFLGLGCIVRDCVNIAERSFIGAGAVVLSDTEPGGVYVGNPARKIQKSSIDV